MRFQDLIDKLQRFWAARGCAVLQPLDMCVGAGTFHPATFLRAIGPEPWHAVYVQPCRRPGDGRYADNPNRLQRYYQMQVVLKPSPDDFQEAYLASLAALGISQRDDDVRFVEDDWESPTLGAWGLGWEVWLNGMEVTQMTYFQEVGGLRCRPVMGEITYGLERLCMHLQGCDSVFDLAWNGALGYGELYRVNESEQSAYNFEHADTGRLRAEFDHCEKTCALLLGNTAPAIAPAYEKVMQCSHAFNLLDARGVVSVTERALLVRRVRDMSGAVARAYAAQRKKLGHPLLARA